MTNFSTQITIESRSRFSAEIRIRLTRHIGGDLDQSYMHLEIASLIETISNFQA
jgi:hypothetical protein